MLLAIILPLWYSSVLAPVIPETYSTAETPQVHIEKEFHTPKDHTILSSTPDAVYGSNCVSLVRVYRPDAPGVNASEYPVATTTPSVGAIGKIRYNNGVWHVFYVLEALESTLKIVDGNYDEGFVTVRVIPRYDARIAGYYL